MNSLLLIAGPDDEQSSSYGLAEVNSTRGRESVLWKTENDLTDIGHTTRLL